MTRPAAIAGSVWADWAELIVELGTVGSWSPSGPAWGVGAWGVDKWGSGYLTAAFSEITASVVSLDIDTGRNGVDDPGEIGTANLVLDDREGSFGIAGNKEEIGNLLRVMAKHVAGQTWRTLFYGKIVEATADESLSGPSISMHAVDMLGSVLASDDADPLLAQTVRERLDTLLDRAAFPATLRILDPDTTRLLAVDKAGSRLDAARGAVASSVGGTLFAVGDGTIRYEHGTTNVDPAAEPNYYVGTIAGSICPTTLTLGEKSARIVNVYDWQNADQNDATRLRSTLAEADSIHHYGRCASVRTDLLNALGADLDALVHSELARTAWGSEVVEAVGFTIHDDASAELVLAQIGELVQFDYTGADPWSALQVIGRYSHHISADAWTIELGAYRPIIESVWGVAQWGISTWGQ
jgi:hypothetical protein